MNIALVVGHHIGSKGAFSHHFKRSEWGFYNEVIDCMPLKGDGYEFDVYHHENVGGYTARIKKTARKLNALKYDLVIELHFNSANDPRANGCETLYYFASKQGKEYAKLFSDTVTQWTGIKSRNGGLKALTNKKDRGFASVYYPKSPTILIEPFFGSNKSDCEKIESPELVGQILLDFVNTIK